MEVKSKVIWKNIMLFCLGGSAYQGLELLWRGRTDSSMFVAGGLCFLLVGHLNVVQPRLPRFPRAVVGALIITMVELAVGLTVNLDYHVWDYRNVPGNYLGQICPRFFLLWIPVAWLAGLLHEFLDKEITGRLCRPVGDQFRA